MRQCINKLVNLFRAKDNLLFVNTYEENALVKEICNASRLINEKKLTYNIPADIYVYTRPDGMYKLDIMSPLELKPENHIKEVKNHLMALDFIDSLQNNVKKNKEDLMQMAGIESDSLRGKTEDKKGSSIFIFKDMHLYFGDKDFIRKIRNLKEEYGDKKTYCPIIFTAPVMELSPELEKIFTVFDFELMNRDDIRKMISPMLIKLCKDKPVDEVSETINSVASACMGLTEREITRALAHSLAKNNKEKIDRADIYEEKLQIIRKSNALDYIEPSHNIDDLGGCANFKEWIYKVKEAITPEAKEFGIPHPKGAMLVGVPGTSKTVSAEILASYLGVPLLSLDMAKVMGSLVGQSERQIANALRVAQAVAPCVLLVDEAEKAWAGHSSSSQCDAGTLSRTMGQLLTFLNKDDTGVITIMTSNDVSILPPELTRTGRLDAQWCFDLPNSEERREIINIYLKKNKLECEGKELDYFVKQSENYTGAEIRGAVKEMLVACFYRQKNSNTAKFNRKLTTSDIDAGLSSIVTIYKSSKEKIDGFREFAKTRYLNASKPEETKRTAVKPNNNFFSIIPGSKSKKEEAK